MKCKNYEEVATLFDIYPKVFANETLLIDKIKYLSFIYIYLITKENLWYKILLFSI